MTHCVYNTDPNWIESLKTSEASLVDFWRKDVRPLKLKVDDYFYFKVRGTQKIAGRAEFVETKIQSIGEAWNEFGLGNGVKSEEEFNSQAVKILHLTTGTIRSIVLKNPIWLKPENFIDITTEMFPRNILASKYFQTSELGYILQVFKGKIDNTIIASEPDELLDYNEYEEGRKRLFVKHYLRERNKQLIEDVKKSRKWVCEICSMDFEKAYGVDYIEAHHKKPLQYLTTESIMTSHEDIALLCANCHRAVHRYMMQYPDAEYENIVGKIKANFKG